MKPQLSKDPKTSKPTWHDLSFEEVDRDKEANNADAYLLKWVLRVRYYHLQAKGQLVIFYHCLKYFPSCDNFHQLLSVAFVLFPAPEVLQSDLAA